MADVTAPEPVKVILAGLWSDRAKLDQALSKAESIWGPREHSGPDHPFQETNFYTPEMGERLYRRIVSFERLVEPDFLAEAKHVANRIEEQCRSDRGRTVNLDIGYLDHNKVVLASMKPAGQKIYLGRGVYADLTFRYGQGGYKPFEWTFLDLRDGRYQKELLEIREIYLRQRKMLRGQS